MGIRNSCTPMGMDMLAISSADIDIGSEGIPSNVTMSGPIPLLSELAAVGRCIGSRVGDFCMDPITGLLLLLPLLVLELSVVLLELLSLLFVMIMASLPKLWF